jgi:hypothetical protein
MYNYFAVAPPDFLIRNDENLPGLLWNVLRNARENAPFHYGAILALRRFHGERGHIRVVPWRRLLSGRGRSAR